MNDFADRENKDQSGTSVKNPSGTYKKIDFDAKNLIPNYYDTNQETENKRLSLSQTIEAFRKRSISNKDNHTQNNFDFIKGGSGYHPNFNAPNLLPEEKYDYINFGAGQDTITQDYVNQNLGNAKHIKISSSVKSIEPLISSLESIDLSGCSALQEIPPYAFQYCNNLKSVKLPNSLKSIEYFAFRNCRALKSINFPSSLIGIKDSAFLMSGIEDLDLSGCSALEEIKLMAFQQCDALKSVEFPSSLKIIGSSAFICCNALKSVKFGNSLKIIGSSAFNCCKALKSIKLPSSLIAIKDSAFAYSGLEEVDLSDCNSLDYTSEYAFWGCDALKNIKFPSSWNKIRYDEFSYSGLEEVNLSGFSSLEDIEPFKSSNSGPENLDLSSLSALEDIK